MPASTSILLSLSIILHILCVGLGSQNHYGYPPIIRGEPPAHPQHALKGHAEVVVNDIGASAELPAHPQQVLKGHAEVVVNEIGAASTWRAEPSEKGQSAAISQQPPRRRGVLQPPMSMEKTDIDAGSKKNSIGTGQQPSQSFARGSGQPKRHRSAKSTPEKMRKHHRQAAETWRFRGPKRFPLLSDPRYTEAEKEKELERLMEKLHLEFFHKKEIGHSRLAQARAMFYEVVDDYKTLTGRDHPPAFLFEELPTIAGSAVEIEEDQDITEVDDQVLVPDDMPTCLLGCQAAGPSCFTDASKWSSTEACTCYTNWLTCSVNLCSSAERDTEGFFIALDTAEAEACAWPHAPHLYEHLHIANLKNKPALVTDDGDGPSTDFLEMSDAGPLGFTIAPLLETEAKMEANTSYRKDDGKTNKPTGCKVSHPEMLGDGNCDGGSYNSKECNYDGGDCCDKNCRPAKHRCGTSGYQCSGLREAARPHKKFKCDQKKVPEFNEFYDLLRDRLTLGDAMISSGCSQLKKEEHQQLAQAFNLGIELGSDSNAKIASAAAQKGGPGLMINCELWDNEMGSDWFGTLITHEIGHVAGYGHPDFKQVGMVYASKCENLGSSLCAGHCKEWTKACSNHLIFGSQGCGFAKTGCQTSCVHSDYCFSMPERTTECFGYMKVHSRGESLWDNANAKLGKANNFFKGLFGMGGAIRSSVALPVMLAMAAMLPLIGGGVLDL